MSIRLKARARSLFLEELECRELLNVDMSFTQARPTDTPVVGDWDGDGASEIGIWRNGTWVFDSNGDNVLSISGGDNYSKFGAKWRLNHQVPLVGDWDGDGVDDIGMYDKLTRYFRLDTNGSNKWEKDDFRGRFVRHGGQPVIGDWNGDGIDDIGVYASSFGIFKLDSNGDGNWDGRNRDSVSRFSRHGQPVGGNWNGEGADEIGVFIPQTSTWRLDFDGDGSWSEGDKRIGANGGFFGQPVPGKYGSSSADVLAVFDDAVWRFDTNQNYQFEHPPEVHPIALHVMAPETSKDILVVATDVNSHDTLRLSVGSLPDFALFTDHGDGTGTITASPGMDDGGTYSLTVVAADRAPGSPLRQFHSRTFDIVVSESIVTPHETIPNFAQDPTIVSATNGNWSDPSTWSGNRLPTESDIVQITSGTQVVVNDTNAIASVVGVADGGHLKYRTDVDTKLRVWTLLVLEGGYLEIGSQAAPVEATVQATLSFLDQPIDTVIDPEQYGTGLLGLGTVTIHGAEMTTGHVLLAEDPRAGDTTLSLSKPVTGWRPGDRLVIPDTRQVRSNLSSYEPQWELPAIQSVSNGGLTVVLTSSLQYDHVGAKDGNGNPEFLAHVGNLSRNVQVRPENVSTNRGHVMFFHRAEVDVRYAAFKFLGRTTTQNLDNTVYGDNGEVEKVGTNQEGRYPVHFSHVIGPESPLSNGYQYSFVGNTIACHLPSHQFKWGLTLNDSHYGLVSKNLIYHWAGAGIVTVTGSETGNNISENFVVRTGGRLGRAAEPLGTTFWRAPGTEGSGVWLRGPNNIVDDNVVASSINYGFTVYTQYAGRYAVVNGESQYLVTIPAFQGADPTVNGTDIDVNATSMLSFRGNESYGATPRALTVWWTGATSANSKQNVEESIVKDFKAWHFTEYGLFGYAVNNYTVDGFTARGDISKLDDNLNLRIIGISWYDYKAENLLIKNADIQNLSLGIEAPMHTKDRNGDQGTTRIVDSYLRNYVNIQIRTPWSVHGGAGIPPRRTVIRNVIFDSPDTSQINPPTGWDPLNISMSYRPTAGSNVVVNDEVLVYSYNGNIGDDFQVFYKEQAPSFIVPMTGSLKWLIGSSEAGLTNLESDERHGLAIAGMVAPTDEMRSLIDGLILDL